MQAGSAERKQASCQPDDGHVCDSESEQTGGLAQPCTAAGGMPEGGLRQSLDRLGRVERRKTVSRASHLELAAFVHGHIRRAESHVKW